MKLKAILSDLDGTLIDKENKTNPETKELIARIKSKGVHFSIATGRAFFGEAEKILAGLDLFGYHIFYGGGMIYNNKSKQALFSIPISSDSVKKVVEYFLKTKIVFILETKDSPYMSKIIEDPFYVETSLMKKLTDLKDYSSVIKILVSGKFNNMVDKDIEIHRTNISKFCHDVSLMKFNFFGKFGMDITSEKASKHTAVLEYEKFLNIPRDQIVAMGDSHNDYPLFTACGYKIAIGNAPAELKEIANFIAPPIQENGTAIALKHIISKFNL